MTVDKIPQKALPGGIHLFFKEGKIGGQSHGADTPLNVFDTQNLSLSRLRVKGKDIFLDYQRLKVTIILLIRRTLNPVDCTPPQVISRHFVKQGDYQKNPP